MNLFKKPLLLAALTTVLFAFAAQPAAALTFILNTGNVGLTGTSTGPYGEVGISLVDADTATITLTAYTGAYQFLFGDGGTIALNVNGTPTAFAAGDVISAAGLGMTGPFSNGGAGQQDGWGNFNFSINNFDGFTRAVNSFVFTLNAPGATWASANDVLTANADGNLLSAHVFIANLNGTNTGVTGFATNGVPDGGMTMSLLGLALAGMGLMARRKNLTVL